MHSNSVQNSGINLRAATNSYGTEAAAAAAVALNAAAVGTQQLLYSSRSASAGCAQHTVAYGTACVSCGTCAINVA